MFWFWFDLVVNALMIGLDAAWWVAALRLTKRRLWRVLVSVFMAGQMAALLMLVGRLDWPSHTPKALLVAVFVWHFFGLFFVLALFLPLGMARARAWMLGVMTRVTGVGRHLPLAVPSRENSVTRREFIGAAAALAPPLFTVGMTGVALAQLNNFRVRRSTLLIPALPKALDGITIAHLSDIHVGRLMSGRVLREMVNTTNALRADLVMLTGDLINYELTDLSEAIALVKTMEGRHGLWMVEGNHDLAVDGGEFQRRVRAAGVPFLSNESAVATVRGYPVQLFGLGWMAGEAKQRERATAYWVRKLMKQRQPEAFPVLLSHHPHAFDVAVEANLPLTLSGHTHGGQWMLDGQHGVGPALFRYWSGLYARGGSQLMVSNGVGSWFPVRINAPAEIVHLTLRCAGTQG